MLDEIELYGELVIAASASDQPLSRDEIDRVLGPASAAEGDPQRLARSTAARARGRRPGRGPGLPRLVVRWP